MNADELRLLRSYEKGPRIWDAASVVPTVVALVSKGLIEPSEGAAYQLTEAGRRALDDRDYPDGQGNDARLQRWLVDQKTDRAIRQEGSQQVSMTGSELYDLLFSAVEWAYWNGVNDVRSA